MKYSIHTVFCLLLPALLIVSGCIEDPEPGPGFEEPFYVRFDFNGTTYTFEEEDTEIQYGLQVNTANIFTNYFKSNPSFDLYISVYLPIDPDQEDIRALAGKNIAVEGDNGAPWIRFYLEGAASYSTDVDPIDYIGSSFVVEEVIKGPMIDYDDPLTGDDRKGRSFILRGTFDFDISLNSWSAGVPVEFFPITNGQFSIRVFAP